jgi:transposase
MRRAPVIELTESERETLARWAHGQRVELRLVERARMILLAAEGKTNREIAAELKSGQHKVGRWRQRFADRRRTGIERDAPRSGRKPVLRDKVAGRIIETTTQERPAAATHWSTRTLAQHLGVKRDMVRRVWKAAGLKPHRVRTFKLSNDPRFVEKVVDVVGLYLNPPEHALVLSVDEKSQIQALDRTQPGLPLKKGRCGTRTHDYVRNGTTTLFAALNVADGRTIGTCMPRHRHEEWLTFLRQIDRQTPADLVLHLILDNYQTHKHPKVKQWLARHPRFHMHFIPTSSSWLNLVERWFRDLTEKSIRRGVFRSVPELIATIERYIDHRNRDPKPLLWTAQAGPIIAKIERAKAVLHNVRH